MVRVSRREFERLVLEALDGLPFHIKERLDNVDVVVSDWPSREDMEYAGIEDPHERFRAQLELAGSLGAEAAVFLPRMIPSKHLAAGNRYEGCEILWHNSRYVLVRLLGGSLRGAPEPTAG